MLVSLLFSGEGRAGGQWGREKEIEVEDTATCKVVVPPIGKKDRREKRKFDFFPVFENEGVWWMLSHAAAA